MFDLHALRSGAPPALPPVLDRVAEAWAHTTPRLRWLAVAATALILLAVVGRGAVRSPWGPPVHVVVAARDVAGGVVLTEEDLAIAVWPRDLASGVAASTAAVVGQVALRAVGRGQPVTLDAVGDGGFAGALAVGRAAVVVTDPTMPPVTVGWWVDVVAQTYDGDARVVAAAARVVAVDGDRVWLDVARGDAPGVVAASARGDASLVLLPPG